MTVAAQSDVLSRAIATLREDYEELLADGVRACSEGVPAFSDPDLLLTLVRSFDITVPTMLTLLEAGELGESRPVPEPTLALARDLVHLGAGPDAIHHGYRLGHAWFHKRVVAAVAAEASTTEELHAATERITDWCYAWFERMHALLTEVTNTELAMWQPTAAAIRAAVIGSVLDGTCEDIDAASLTLGYDLRGDHLAAIVWHEAPAPSVNLRTVVSRTLRDVAEGTPFVHEASSSSLWVWLPAKERAGAVDLADDVLLAIGEPGRGVEGFRRSHEQAQRARHVISLHGGGAPIMRTFRDVEMIALLAAGGDDAQAFVLDTLGPLAADDEQSRRLRETLAAVFDEPSISAAAARLGVHHNTVTYRVRKAEELLGPDAFRERLRLQMAIHLADGLGLFRPS